MKSIHPSSLILHPFRSSFSRCYFVVPGVAGVVVFDVVVVFVTVLVVFLTGLVAFFFFDVMAFLCFLVVFLVVVVVDFVALFARCMVIIFVDDFA